jgi:hypothetical protein
LKPDPPSVGTPHDFDHLISGSRALVDFSKSQIHQ